MRLLQLRPQIRQNWTALAVGHHLQGDPAGAVKILASFEDTLKVVSRRHL
jgi:N-alpha-acetyltransferase 15/16, NatA auxiliary subunit